MKSQPWTTRLGPLCITSLDIRYEVKYMLLMSWIRYKKKKKKMGNPVFLLHSSPITEGCSRYDSRTIVPGDLAWITNCSCDVSQLCSPAYLGSMMEWICAVFLTALSSLTPFVFLMPNTHLHGAKHSSVDCRLLILRPLCCPTPTCLCFPIVPRTKPLVNT